MQSIRKPTIHDQRYQKTIKILINTRKSFGISQAELAEKLHFTQPDISKIERLERRIDITEFFDILDALANGDRPTIDKIWREIHECHSQSRKSKEHS